jgi:hypothetical protein
MGVTAAAPGTGAHTNFSTESMRVDGGMTAIMAAIEKLSKTHAEHIAQYGSGARSAAAAPAAGCRRRAQAGASVGRRCALGGTRLGCVLPSASAAASRKRALWCSCLVVTPAEDWRRVCNRVPLVAWNAPREDPRQSLGLALSVATSIHRAAFLSGVASLGWQNNKTATGQLLYTSCD